jgi:hypothetical protein
MKGRLGAVACLSTCLAIAGCGGSGAKVSPASLQPRLLPSSSISGFGLQRTLDWSDPVNLVGEGLALPQRTHPSEAVKEFTGAHFKGAAGEVLSKGAGLEETAARVGVARFDSPADAERVRDWMHTEDLKQPCYSQCIFAPGAVAVSGIPSMRFVVQSGHAPPPPGAPPTAHLLGPANYLGEFTVGPYLYWAILQGNSGARSSFEAGLRLYYAHAKRVA